MCSSDLNVDNIYDNNFQSATDNSACLLYADRADGLTLSGITFEGIAEWSRAALMLDSSKVAIDNCIFTHNFAMYDGGGASCISMFNKCVLNIEKSLFEQNVVAASGLIATGYRTAAATILPRMTARRSRTLGRARPR